MVSAFFFLSFLKNEGFVRQCFHFFSGLLHVDGLRLCTHSLNGISLSHEIPLHVAVVNNGQKSCSSVCTFSNQSYISFAEGTT